MPVERSRDAARPLLGPLPFAVPLALALACASPVVEPPDAPDAPADPGAAPAPVDGWTIYVHGPDGVEERHVAPRPGGDDGDGDGLDDATEYALRLDPTRADTDGDGLDDGFEVRELGSRADHIDSDGDAAGDPRLWDGGEVEQIGSSPALADTDGDGFDDRYEVVELRTDPRVADLPRLELRLESLPEIGLNTVLATGETHTIGVDESVTRSIQMTQGESHAVQESIALAVGFGVEAGFSGAFSFGVNASTQLTTTSSVTLTLDRSYTEAASAAISRARQRAESRELTVQGGYVAFPVTLANTGPVAFTLKNASMTLLHRDPRNPWSRRALSHIETADGRTAFPPRTLAPGDAHRSVYFRRDNLGWDDAVALIADPRGLEVEVSGYELVDAEGRAFAHDGTLRRTRTATIVIDHGPDFAAGPAQTQAVLATNLRLDPATGAPAGLDVETALVDWLGRDFEVRAVGGVRILAAVDGHRADGSMAGDGISRWNVVRVRGGIAETVTDDFDTIRLMPGDALYLVYDEDRDGDGLGVRTERRLGTDDTLEDTDGDGLTDAEEVLHGQAPDDPMPSHAISDPTRADTDGDGLSDADERRVGTDAFAADTDGDGLSDAVDRAPLDVDRFALEDLDARPIDDGARLELSWAPVENPGIEGIYVLREPADALGRFAEVPEDTLAYTPADLAERLGATLVGALAADATGLVDQPGDGATVWRYLAFVAYAEVGLLPAGVWVIEHERVQRFDRLRVVLERLDHVGSDDCSVYWQMAVSAADSALRDSAGIGPGGAVRMDGADVGLGAFGPDAVAAEAVVPRDGAGLDLTLELWSTDVFGSRDRMGSQTARHTLADAEAGGRFALAFDQLDDPGECRVDAVYRLEVVERGLVDPGPGF